MKNKAATQKIRNFFKQKMWSASIRRITFYLSESHLIDLSRLRYRASNNAWSNSMTKSAMIGYIELTKV